MIKFFKNFFKTRYLVYIDDTEIETASSKKLLNILKLPDLSLKSGNAIVKELLKRLIESDKYVEKS